MVFAAFRQEQEPGPNKRLNGVTSPLRLTALVMSDCSALDPDTTSKVTSFIALFKGLFEPKASQ